MINRCWGCFLAVPMLANALANEHPAIDSSRGSSSIASSNPSQALLQVHAQIQNHHYQLNKNNNNFRISVADVNGIFQVERALALNWTNKEAADDTAFWIGDATLGILLPLEDATTENHEEQRRTLLIHLLDETMVLARRVVRIARVRDTTHPYHVVVHLKATTAPSNENNFSTEPFAQQTSWRGAASVLVMVILAVAAWMVYTGTGDLQQRVLDWIVLNGMLPVQDRFMTTEEGDEEYSEEQHEDNDSEDVSAHGDYSSIYYNNEDSHETSTPPIPNCTEIPWMIQPRAQNQIYDDASSEESFLEPPNLYRLRGLDFQTTLLKHTFGSVHPVVHSAQDAAHAAPELVFASTRAFQRLSISTNDTAADREQVSGLQRQKPVSDLIPVLHTHQAVVPAMIPEPTVARLFDASTISNTPSEAMTGAGPGSSAATTVPHDAARLDVQVMKYAANKQPSSPPKVHASDLNFDPLDLSRPLSFVDVLSANKSSSLACHVANTETTTETLLQQQSRSELAISSDMTTVGRDQDTSPTTDMVGVQGPAPLANDMQPVSHLTNSIAKIAASTGIGNCSDLELEHVTHTSQSTDRKSRVHPCSVDDNDTSVATLNNEQSHVDTMPELHKINVSPCTPVTHKCTVHAACVTQLLKQDASSKLIIHTQQAESPTIISEDTLVKLLDTFNVPKSTFNVTALNGLGKSASASEDETQGGTRLGEIAVPLTCLAATEQPKALLDACASALALEKASDPPSSCNTISANELFDLKSRVVDAETTNETLLDQQSLTEISMSSGLSALKQDLAKRGTTDTGGVQGLASMVNNVQAASPLANNFVQVGASAGIDNYFEFEFGTHKSHDHLIRDNLCVVDNNHTPVTTVNSEQSHIVTMPELDEIDVSSSTSTTCERAEPRPTAYSELKRGIKRNRDSLKGEEVEPAELNFKVSTTKSYSVSRPASPVTFKPNDSSAPQAKQSKCSESKQLSFHRQIGFNTGGDVLIRTDSNRISLALDPLQPVLADKLVGVKHVESAEKGVSCPFTSIDTLKYELKEAIADITDQSKRIGYSSIKEAAAGGQDDETETKSSEMESDDKRSDKQNDGTFCCCTMTKDKTESMSQSPLVKVAVLIGNSFTESCFDAVAKCQESDKGTATGNQVDDKLNVTTEIEDAAFQIAACSQGKEDANHPNIGSIRVKFKSGVAPVADESPCEQDELSAKVSVPSDLQGCVPAMQADVLSFRGLTQELGSATKFEARIENPPIFINRTENAGIILDQKAAENRTIQHRITRNNLASSNDCRAVRTWVKPSMASCNTGTQGKKRNTRTVNGNTADAASITNRLRNARGNVKSSDVTRAVRTLVKPSLQSSVAGTRIKKRHILNQENTSGSSVHGQYDTTADNEPVKSPAALISKRIGTAEHDLQGAFRTEPDERTIIPDPSPDFTYVSTLPPHSDASQATRPADDLEWHFDCDESIDARRRGIIGNSTTSKLLNSVISFPEVPEQARKKLREEWEQLHDQKQREGIAFVQRGNCLTKKDVTALDDTKIAFPIGNNNELNKSLPNATGLPVFPEVVPSFSLRSAAEKYCDENWDFSAVAQLRPSSRKKAKRKLPFAPVALLPEQVVSNSNKYNDKSKGSGFLNVPANIRSIDVGDTTATLLKKDEQAVSISNVHGISKRPKRLKSHGMNEQKHSVKIASFRNDNYPTQKRITVHDDSKNGIDISDCTKTGESVLHGRSVEVIRETVASSAFGLPVLPEVVPSFSMKSAADKYCDENWDFSASAKPRPASRKIARRKQPPVPVILLPDLVFSDSNKYKEKSKGLDSLRSSQMGDDACIRSADLAGCTQRELKDSLPITVTSQYNHLRKSCDKRPLCDAEDDIPEVWSEPVRSYRKRKAFGSHKL
jgi:hypothetical protein